MPAADATPGSGIRIRVRYFAMQREQLGRRDEELAMPAGPATIGDAWAALVEAHPVLAPAAGAIRFARNGRYAGPDEGLEDGDELALIPPVAGGADERPSQAIARLALTAQPIDDQRIAELMASVPDPGDGAVVLFLGRTRSTPGTPAPGQEAEAERHAGRRVEALDYEAYEPMALAELERIAGEIADRFGVTGVAILHRTGEVALGETSVAIVTAAPHRDAAFDACRYAIEELKARAPIWKSERFADGSVWLGAPPRAGPLEPPSESKDR
jgi:molybdopterin synthase catalytic subunit/molybdopterin converting factor small subunit